MKKLLLTLVLLVYSCGFAQLPWPVDVEFGSKWFLTNEASLFGSARTYIPTGVNAFGVQVFAIPEVGYHYESLEPYAALELNADAEYATFAVWGTYMQGVASLSLAMRFCVLSDQCSN